MLLDDKKFVMDMQKMNQCIQDILASNNAQIQEIMNWVTGRQGKQLRPQMVLLSARCGNKPEADVTEYAAIIEILHMASLVHDDIIDKSAMRRGKESVQHKFGQKMAVYAGDYMIFSALNVCFDIFNIKYRFVLNMLRELCDGELGQNSLLYNLDINEEQYIYNITGKTAKVFELACKIGAMVGGCTSRSIDNLAQFGKYYGILFQMHDDILDFQTEAVMPDKPVFQDFNNGIYTLPVIYSCENSQVKEKVLQLQRNKELHSPSQKELLSIINETDWHSRMINKVEEIYHTAYEGLSILKGNQIKTVFENLLGSCYEDTVMYINKVKYN